VRHLDLILEGPDRPPAEAVAFSVSLLDQVARGERPDTLRVIRPRPTFAFGRLDALRDRYADASALARSHGFEPVVRAPGGHAAAYHEQCLVIEETVHEPDAISGMQDRFRTRGEMLAGSLRSLGVDARLGAVPDEYCPGAYSVNARGAVKLVGTAQRIVRNGWLFASVVTIGDTEPLRRALAGVYEVLGMPMDPETVAGVADEVPGLGVDEVRDAVLAAFRERSELAPTRRM
jgi:lipoate-protein ligase A